MTSLSIAVHRHGCSVRTLPVTGFQNDTVLDNRVHGTRPVNTGRVYRSPLVTNIRFSQCDSNGQDWDKDRLLNRDFEKKCAQCTQLASVQSRWLYSVVDSVKAVTCYTAGIVSSDATVSEVRGLIEWVKTFSSYPAIMLPNRALLFTISAIVEVAHIISAPSKSLIVHRV